MVKFSKELEAQLIPEWKEAFVNYWQLKKNVKKIKLTRKPSKQCTNPQDMNSHFGQSIFDPVRYAITHISAKVMSCAGEQSPDIIQVRSRKLPRDEEQPQDEDEDEGEVYETELLHLFSEEDEVRAFFEILDAELNKVNRFYRIKEIEFLERGESLSKQLQTLLDLNQVRADRRRKAGMLSRSFSSSVQSSNRSSHRGSTDSSVRSSNCGSHRSSDYSESFSFSNIGSQTDGATPERGSLNLVTSAMAARTRTQSNYGRPAKTADAAAMTPQRAITAATTMLWEDLVKNPKKEGSGHADFMSRKKVQCAEKMIRNAFVELYKGLGLLKTYSTLNMVAFTKILKKFDKVSNQQASASYLKAVKRSHFISSDKVVRLMDEVESLFTKHFANSDRKKAMKFLRPQQQKDSHMVTFFVGLFTGCFVTLFSVYAILAHLSGMFSAQIQEKAAYMETIYPVFSMFALLSLHVFMYGCNLFMWKSTRINYNFIFEFSSATSLKYRDAFLICTSFMTAVVGAMVVHLILRESGVSPGRVDAIPGILLLVFTVLLICPFNILYHSTRYCFLRVIRNIVCSPFYKVLMVDFFMADQLTSQIPLLRHMESTACYFLAGSFKTHQYETCKSGRLYRELAYVISFMPYYWRAMQCARRWFDECDANHLLNLGKYVSAMVAAGARLTYARQPTNLWMAIVLVTSVIATLYQLYWDFAKDWGFFKPNSRNPWLRDDLILKNKSIYYISIALNLVLRVAWVETVIRFRIGMFETRMLDFFLASLEVIRRGHWNFYRLENEHLNNVGKFRAVKTVPLPFRETDSDG